MPELETFTSHVQARTAEEFAFEIEEALRTDSDSNRRERLQAVQDMTWEARMQNVARHVEERLRAKGGAA